ncbi:MAG: response regulator [Candidatus Schekmanbacteria bacterium]|nr:response regulator [Candidatus Schekmanbacteria bacterium]
MVQTQKTILIVDDEETLTWSMSKNLSLNNRYKVICANSGEEALDVLQKAGNVDLVVSDIKMQGKDGLQLLGEVKAKYPKTGFIIMTAYGSNEKRQEALAKGAIRYMEKPFMMDQVKGVINEVLEEMERTFQPLDGVLKQKVRENEHIQDFFGNKCQGVEKLTLIQLSTLDGESLLGGQGQAGQDNLHVIQAAKVLSRIQVACEKINVGPAREIVFETEKSKVIVRSIADHGLFLYFIFDQTITLGKALLLVDQIDARVKDLLA